MMNKIIAMATVSLFISGCTTGSDVGKKESVHTEMTVGEKLHQASCVKCHTSSVYTRSDRTVKSMDSLKQRIEVCNSNVGANLSDSEASAVSEYLNTNYYKFN